jgi:hypothetical protein
MGMSGVRITQTQIKVAASTLGVVIMHGKLERLRGRDGRKLIGAAFAG